VLEEIGSSIWLADGGTVDFYGFPYPTRMVIIRLTDSPLWIWSPVELTDELRREVDALGPVEHLVSPNRIHHLFLSSWQTAYPDARLWGPESTIRKRRDLVFQAPLNNEPPPDWAQQIDQFWFTGSPFLDEVVFFHRASRTAILADLSENFSASFLERHWAPWKRSLARLWRIVEPWGYAPLELRLSWWRKTAARHALNRLLDANPERVIMAHGEWQRSNGRNYLAGAFRWLDPTVKDLQAANTETS
jgi:uncharacterized protein YjiS (DUF1127 family)